MQFCAIFSNLVLDYICVFQQQMFVFLLQPRGRLPALMGIFDWLVGELDLKAGWKSASMGDGEQCVMTPGEVKKLRWSADSRGTQLKVGACLSV